MTERRMLVGLIFAVGCSSPPPPPPPTPAPEPIAEPVQPDPQPEIPAPKIALVLGGGGARGFAHVGVLRVLEQEKIPISLVVGTSVGSLIGAMYAANPDTFELEWKSFQIEKDDLFDFSLFSASTGPVKGEAIQQFVRENIGAKAIEELPIQFIAVAADLNTGELVELDKGSVAGAVRASVSIPGVFTPAKVGNRTLVDGGVVSNVAVEVARRAGADIIIASNITEDVVDYEVTDVVSIILQSINIMMSKMAKQELTKADVVITPKIGDVGTMDFSHKKRCMQEGIAATRQQVAAIQAAIANYYTEHGADEPHVAQLR